MAGDQGGGASGQQQQETTWFGGGSEATAENWDFVREAEQYMEKTYTSLVTGEELPLIQLLAALSLSRSGWQTCGRFFSHP